MIKRLSQIFKNLPDKLQDSIFQKKLKRINMVLSIISLAIVINIYIDSETKGNINISFGLDELIMGISFYLVQGIIWTKFMKANYSGNTKDYFYNWSLSKIGKYIPTGLLVVSVRINQKLKNNSSSKKIFYGLLEEQFLFPFILIPAIAICFLINIPINGIFIWFLISTTCFFIVKYIYSKFEKTYISLITFKVLYLMLINFNFALTYIIANNLNFEDPYRISLAYVLSASLGLFFIGVPAGIGIREFLFLLITNGMNLQYDLLILLVKMRAIFIMFDIFFGLLGFIQSYLKKNNKF